MNLWARRFLGLAMWVAIAPLAWSAATLRGVEVDAATANGARITLRASGPVAEKVFSLDSPHRLVVDLPATKLADGLALPKSAGPVKAVRSGLQPGSTLRLVFEHAGIAWKVRDAGAGVIVIEFGNAIG
ncbi:MAG: AMIN domain-containing protein, partial [Nevskiaceae bacterium]|nr:AMIN domain-containing protein [Nevskiaceae bacterium]